MKKIPENYLFKFKNQKCINDMKASEFDLKNGYGLFLSPSLHDVKEFRLMDEICSECGKSNHLCPEIEIPKDHEEFTKAKERMREYAKEKDKIVEKYFRVTDYDGNIYISDTLDEKEADKCIEEGEHKIIDTEFSGKVSFPLRMKSTHYRKVMPMSSEV